jgi:hypothetical protein
VSDFNLSAFWRELSFNDRGYKHPSVINKGQIVNHKNMKHKRRRGEKEKISATYLLIDCLFV